MKPQAHKQTMKYSGQRLQWRRCLICTLAATLFLALAVQAQEEMVPPSQFLEGVACPLFGCSDSPPPPLPLPLECRLQGAADEPQFKSGPPRAAYFFRGMCSDTNPGDSVSYRVTGTWNPSQNDPSQPNAAEVYVITGKDAPQSGGAGYTQRVGFSAHCDSDPWLTSSNCTRLSDTLPDALRQTWPSIATTEFPNTRDAIPLAQRGPLHGEYNRINGIKYPPRPGTARAIETGSRGSRSEENELEMTNVQDVVNQRSQLSAFAPTMMKKIDESEQGVVANLGDEGGTSNSPTYAQPHPAATANSSNAANRAVILRQPMKADPPICARARDARSRNSPVAPALEARCRAAGGTL